MEIYMMIFSRILDNEKFNIRDALRIAIRSEEFNKFIDTQ